MIRAPFDGVVGNKAVEAGAYVSPGSRIAALVPLQSVRVVRAVPLMALAALLAVLLASPPAVCPSPGRLRRASLPAAPAPHRCTLPTAQHRPPCAPHG